MVPFCPEYPIRTNNRQEIPGYLFNMNVIAQTYEGSHCELLRSALSAPLLLLSSRLDKLVELVETTLDLERVNQHEYVIKSSFDKGLGDLRGELDACVSKIDKLFRKVGSQVGMECGRAIKLDHTSLLGHFMRVTQKESSAIQDNPNFRVLEARKEGIRFTNSSLQVAFSSVV